MVTARGRSGLSAGGRASVRGIGAKLSEVASRSVRGVFSRTFRSLRESGLSPGRTGIRWRWMGKRLRSRLLVDFADS